MKKIYQYILMAVALVATASCSNELDDTLQPVENGTLQFVVGDFPAFGEGTQTRAIGTQDAGKTEWEENDKLLMFFDSPRYGRQTATLTYTDSQWTLPDGTTFTFLQGETPEITVYYAPICELLDGMLVTEEQLGTCECLEGTGSLSDDGKSISIMFGDRTYSRLRIVAVAGQELTVTTTDFTPAGMNKASSETYTICADDKGNAYLYGTFAEGATVTVKQGDVVLKDYTFTAEKNPNGTEHNKSYALDARPVIDGTLGGKTEATEEELAAMVELLKSYIENGLTTIIVTGSQPALLLKDGYLTPVVSLAFEQLTYAYQDEKNDSYWGAVDLIYQDVTEIVEYEFYCCDVLKSITLPKVTTVGDSGFWACYYLETLTFGSVVTAINDNSGEVFYDLGYKIDGCNLVLNKDQVNAEADYQPNIETRTWWNTEWKSITLK